MRRTLIAATTALTVFIGSAASADGTVDSTATAPTISLKAASNEVLPGSVADDFGINLGGFGSDLFREPGAAKGEYWVITDRGPNNDVVYKGLDLKGFPVPSYSPIIMRIQVDGAAIVIKEKIAVQSKAGVGVTGLPNVSGYDDTGTAVDAKSYLGFNVNGLDTEGIVRVKDGSFWAVEEYGPSIVHIARTGVVLKRFVPKGWAGTGTDYPVVDSLPGILLKRKVNRGFEALALTPDGKSLFIGLQSPLLNPDKATGNASLATRILKFDLAAESVVAEYAYTFEPIAVVDPTLTKVSELKVSAMVALDSNTLLVQERTDNSFLVAMIQPTDANNILGSDLDDTATRPALEAYPTATASTLMQRMLSKQIVYRSVGVTGMPGKVEGMAVVDATHLAFINDNDFSFRYDTVTASVVAGTTPTQLVVVALAATLPTTPDAVAAAIVAAEKAEVARQAAAAKAAAKAAIKAGAKCATAGQASGTLICKRSGKSNVLTWQKRK